jgi:hypothetical protein
MRASVADVRSICLVHLRVTSGCGGLKRKANVAADSSQSPRSSPSKKQQKSAPLEPPQESCSRCGDLIMLKVTRSEKNKRRRYWSCQAYSQDGHFFEWWQVPGASRNRTSCILRKQWGPTHPTLLPRSGSWTTSRRYNTASDHLLQPVSILKISPMQLL